MKIDIIPTHLKDDLIKEKLNKETSLLNYQCISIDNFINNELNLNTNLYDVYQRLTKLPLKKLKGAILEPIFLSELYQNRMLLDKYHINIDKLEIEDEYKLCLNRLDYIDYSLIDSIINKHVFSNTTIYNANYDLYQKSIINKMIDKGAKLAEFNNKNNQEYVNKSGTIKEAICNIASYIIDNNLNLNDCAIITNSDNFKNIKVNLNLYNIPTKIDNYYFANNAISFTCLMDFYLNPTINNYLNVISSPFKGQDNYQLIKEYLSNHVDELNMDSFDNFNNLDTSITHNLYYIDLEKKANNIHNKYKNELKTLLSLDFKNAIIYVFDLIKDNTKTTTFIKDVLEEYKDNLEAAYFIIKDLIKHKKDGDSNDGLLVTTFDKDLYYKDYLFILDPNINNYPNFKPLEGFINEEALVNTNFPKLEERYINHLNSFNYFNSAKITIYFLVAAIDGKPVEYDAKFVINDNFQNHNLKPLTINTINNENEDLINYNHKLDSNIAKEIFFDNDELFGSISKFETYFNCPYSYFLENGLNLNAPKTLELNAALVGTIVHEIMQKLINNYKKTYFDNYEVITNEVLNKYLNELNHLYPNNIEINKATILRIKNAIDLEMIFISSMEKDSDFIPERTEFRFDNFYLLNENNYKLRLKGFIDRIDTYVNEFRIIDYKTGKKDLSLDKIARGLQLQLLTYAIVYIEISKLDISSIFYMNFKHDKLDIAEFKYSKTNGKGFDQTNINDEICFDEFIKKHKLSGYVFNDNKVIDHNYKHVKTRSKQSISKDRLMDIDKTKELVIDIYKNLIDYLKSGQIDLTPSEDSCKYCNYHSICHFKGLYNKNKIVSDIDIRKGVEENGDA